MILAHGWVRRFQNYPWTINREASGVPPGKAVGCRGGRALGSLPEGTPQEGWGGLRDQSSFDLQASTETGLSKEEEGR